MWNKRLRLVLTHIFLITIFFSISFHDASAGRKALVIGVKNYEHLSILKQPPEDARLMKISLEQFGFEVKLVSETIINDIKIKDIKNAVVEFIGSLEDVDEAVFYFSGHGAQMKDNNYLLGTDSNVTEGLSVLEFEEIGLNVTTVLNDMKSKAAVAILFLDACRNILLSGSKSLGQSKGLSFKQIDLRDEKASFIGFSSQENTTSFSGDGTVSPFTEKLLAALNNESLASKPLPTLYTHVKNEVKIFSNHAQIPDYRNLLGNREFRFLTEQKNLVVTQASPLRSEPALNSFDLVSMFGTMIAVQTVPPRIAPSLSATIATNDNVHEGQEVIVVARTSASDWYQIRLGNDIAYLPANTLQEWEAIELSGETMIVMRPASLLRAPNMTASVSKDLAEGMQVTALAQANGWYRVDAGGHYGYVMDDLLYEWKAQWLSKTMAVTQNVPLRRIPSYKGTLVSIAEKDHQVMALGQMGDWYQLDIGGDRVYIPANYLRDLRCSPVYRTVDETVRDRWEDEYWEESWTRSDCRSDARRDVKFDMEDECYSLGGTLGTVRSELLNWEPPYGGMKGDCDVRVWATCTYTEKRKRHVRDQCK